MKLCNQITASISQWFLIVMVLVSVADSFGRNSLNHPLPASYEIISLLLAGIVFLGLAPAEEAEQHIRVRLLWDKFSRRGKIITDVFARATGAVLFALFAWQSTLVAIDDFAKGAATPGLVAMPIAPFRFLIALGCWLFSLQLAVNLGHRLTKKDLASYPLEGN